MGYMEVYCQLCGVSSAIARLRRADEPRGAAWDYTGYDFAVADASTGGGSKVCGENTDCARLDHRWPLEHIAGPRCVSTADYSGHRISTEEMQGCRAVQALCKKGKNWQPEPDDQEFELESDYFLTGIGDGSPHRELLEDLHPVRHGIDEVWISNDPYDGSTVSAGVRLP